MATEEELAREAADIQAAHDQALRDAGADLVLAGGDARTDELAAEADERERRTGALEEQNAKAIAALTLQLEQQQEFIRQLVAAQSQNPDLSASAQASARRAMHDQMIDTLIARGGRCVVVIHPSADVHQNWPVPLGINGETIFVKRGVATEIPVDYLGVLRDARTVEHQPLLDAEENLVPGGIIIDRPSYPFAVMPTGTHAEERLAPHFRSGVVDFDLRRGANQPRVSH